MRQTLQTKLTVRIGLLLLAATAAVGAVSAWQGIKSVDDLSRRVIVPTTRLATERIEGLLKSAQAEAKLAALTSSAAPDDRVMPELLRQLNAGSGSARITLVDPKRQRAIAAYRVPDGRKFVSMELLVDGEPQTRTWEPFGERLELIGVENGWPQGLTEGEWLTGRKDRGAWSGVRPLRLGQSGVVSGLSYRQPLTSEDTGEERTVVADVLLGEVSSFLSTLSLPAGSVPFLAEEGGLGVLRAAALPAQTLMSVDPESPLPRLDSMPDALIRDIAQRLDQKPMNRSPEAGVEPFFAQRGADRHIVGYRPISLEGGPALVAFVAIPTDAFLGSLKQTVAIVAVLAAIGLAGAIFGSSILAKRVTKPLYAVMNETSRVRELDLKERPLPISGIAEVDELAESVKLMKTSLRSFEKLVPADYARWLMKSGQEAKLEGERRELTIFFADVVGFTRLSEQLGPEELVETLASYFEVLTRAVLREGGTVDKFNGDDVMAFWGAPQVMKDHAERAVRAALSAQTELAALRAEWEAEGIAILDISYGIATGEVIVGNIGNRRRMNYTVIGDAANVASRLEGLNKQLGTSILISNATAGQLSDAFTLRPVENAVIPGRQMSELVWEVLPGAGWSAVAETGRAAWEHEQAGRLEEAKRLYEEGLKLREGDPVSLRALERIARRI